MRYQPQTNQNCRNNRMDRRKRKSERYKLAEPNMSVVSLPLRYIDDSKDGRKNIYEILQSDRRRRWNGLARSSPCAFHTSKQQETSRTRSIHMAANADASTSTLAHTTSRCGRASTANAMRNDAASDEVITKNKIHCSCASQRNYFVCSVSRSLTLLCRNPQPRERISPTDIWCRRALSYPTIDCAVVYTLKSEWIALRERDHIHSQAASCWERRANHVCTACTRLRNKCIYNYYFFAAADHCPLDCIAIVRRAREPLGCWMGSTVRI